MVEHEQWTSVGTEKVRWETGKEKGSHCSGAARRLHDRESHEILCWVVWDGGAEGMKWIFYLAMVTLHF